MVREGSLPMFSRLTIRSQVTVLIRVYPRLFQCGGIHHVELNLHTAFLK